MRARQPDRDGYIERAGVKVFYEVFGEGRPTILLLPAWSVVHSRTWKMQVPYLARHYRVVTFDGRGNGRSGRPAGAASYTSPEYAADALAVLDATGTDRAVVVSLSRGALRAPTGPRAPAGPAAGPARRACPPRGGTGGGARSASARRGGGRRSHQPGGRSRGGLGTRSTGTGAGPRTTPPTGCATTRG